MDLSFSGAGFMGCYYFGVVDCWNKYVPRDRVNRVAGASAGSLIAAYYLMDLPLSECFKEIVHLTEDIRRRPLGVFDRSNQIVDVLPKLLDRLFPEDAHKQVSGRLFVCMTRLKDMKKVIVSEFESKKDLIDALNCSCFIPLWSGNHVSTFRGVKHIDGGFSDNLPIFDENTIRVCCFAGRSDISPYDRAKMEMLKFTVLNTPLYLNFGNCRRFRKALFPPPADYIIGLLERGFHDAKAFILDNDLIQCNKCFSKTQGKLHFDGPSPPMITPGASRQQSRLGSFRAGHAPALNKLNAVKPDESSFRRALEAKLRACSPDSGNESSERAHSPESASSVISAERPALVPPTITLDLCGDDPAADRTLSTINSSALSFDSVRHSADSALGASDKSYISSPTSSSSSSSSSSTGATERAKNNDHDNDDEDGDDDQAALKKRFKPMLKRNSIQVGSLLKVDDKFSALTRELPSCPPSPSLNRHCKDCLTMRARARADLVEEEIKQQADKFRASSEQKRTKSGKLLRTTLTGPIRWLRQMGTKTSYELRQTSEA